MVCFFTYIFDPVRLYKKYEIIINVLQHRSQERYVIVMSQEQICEQISSNNDSFCLSFRSLFSRKSKEPKASSHNATGWRLFGKTAAREDDPATKEPGSPPSSQQVGSLNTLTLLPSSCPGRQHFFWFMFFIVNVNKPREFEVLGGLETLQVESSEQKMKGRKYLVLWQ